MRKVYVLGLAALAGVIIGFAWAEQITLTTYYPAPYGVYKEFETKGKTILANAPGAKVAIGKSDVGTATLDVAGDLQLSKDATEEQVYDAGLQKLAGANTVLWYGNWLKLQTAVKGQSKAIIDNMGRMRLGLTPAGTPLDGNIQLEVLDRPIKATSGLILQSGGNTAPPLAKEGSLWFNPSP